MYPMRRVRSTSMSRPSATMKRPEFSGSPAGCVDSQWRIAESVDIEGCRAAPGERGRSGALERVARRRSVPQRARGSLRTRGDTGSTKGAVAEDCAHLFCSENVSVGVGPNQLMLWRTRIGSTTLVSMWNWSSASTSRAIDRMWKRFLTVSPCLSPRVQRGTCTVRGSRRFQDLEHALGIGRELPRLCGELSTPRGRATRS